MAILAMMAWGGCRETVEQPTDTPESSHQAHEPAQLAPSKPLEPEPKELPTADRVRAQIEQADFETADAAIRQALLRKAKDADWMGLAARSAMAQQRWDEAIEFATQAFTLSIAENRPANWDASCSVAKWSTLPSEIRGQRTLPFAWVWRSMETVLAATPEDHDLRRTLVERLIQHGYRHRANEHVAHLIARGKATTSELRIRIERRESTRGSSLDGPLGRAMNSFQARDYEGALEALADDAGSGSLKGEASAMYGLLLARTRRFGDFKNWLSSCPSSAERYANYWSAQGVALAAAQQEESAVAALLKAIEMDPTFPADYRLLEQMAQRLEDQERSEIPGMAEVVNERRVQVMSTISLANKLRAQPGATFLVKTLAERLVQLGRPLEAIRWQEIKVAEEHAEEIASGRVDPRVTSALAAFDQQRRKLLGAPTFAEAMRRHRRFDVNDDFFPLISRESVIAQIEPLAASEQTNHAPVSSLSDIGGGEPFDLFDVADETGLSFQYLNREPPALSQIRLHESIGGGIGVLDYDRDGAPDLYLGQGSGDYPDSPPTQPSQLFRNLTHRWMLVSAESETDSMAYTLGVASGDWNQDGFADLILGNFGENHWYVNQGDGTFRRADKRWGQGDDEFTSSVVIADTNRDGLSDVVVASYLNDPTVLLKIRPPKSGIPAVVSPNQFKPGANSRWVQGADGSFSRETLRTPGQSAGNSLGVVVSDLLSDSPGNEILVGNDLGANQLWQAVGPNQRSLQDVARQRGIATDSIGASTASMGIAAGDWDGDGALDVHISNFGRESSSLFLRTRNEMFSDQSGVRGLTKETFPWVGFGTQMEDLDCNGQPELVIVNGHIEDLSSLDRPFRMLPQVLTVPSGGTSVVSANVDDPSGYWKRPSLGRTLVRLDWNRDGRVDLVANHLDAPVALLENRTPRRGRWLMLELIGTTSERDPIGTRVTVRCQVEPGKWIEKMAWRVAGGYLGSNENRVHIAMGKIEADRVTVTVDWPSGASDVFHNVRCDQSLIVIEGQDPFTLVR